MVYISSMSCLLEREREIAGEREREIAGERE
jgi:hypothetical protein